MKVDSIIHIFTGVLFILLGGLLAYLTSILSLLSLTGVAFLGTLGSALGTLGNIVLFLCILSGLYFLVEGAGLWALKKWAYYIRMIELIVFILLALFQLNIVGFAVNGAWVLYYWFRVHGAFGFTGKRHAIPMWR